MLGSELHDTAVANTSPFIEYDSSIPEQNLASEIIQPDLGDCLFEDSVFNSM